MASSPSRKRRRVSPEEEEEEEIVPQQRRLTEAEILEGISLLLSHEGAETAEKEVLREKREIASRISKEAKKHKLSLKYAQMTKQEREDGDFPPPLEHLRSTFSWLHKSCERRDYITDQEATFQINGHVIHSEARIEESSNDYVRVSLPTGDSFRAGERVKQDGDFYGELRKLLGVSKISNETLWNFLMAIVDIPYFQNWLRGEISDGEEEEEPMKPLLKGNNKSTSPVFCS